MSKARDEYNLILRTYIENPDVLICDNYILELEQEKAELIEFVNDCIFMNPNTVSNRRQELLYKYTTEVKG